MKDHPMAETVNKKGLKVGDVYPDYVGAFWYVYGWPTDEFFFTSQRDAEHAWKLAKEHATEEVEAVADKVRDVLP